MTDQSKTDQSEQAEKPAKATKPKLIEIENIMPAGKLFTSAGVVGPGERAQLPADEARHFCNDQVWTTPGREKGDEPVTIKRPAKARRPFDS